MWLITTQGFYSGVQDSDDDNLIVVRGRVRGDMQALVAQLPKDARPKIIDNEGTDYPYRVRVTRAQWVRLCCNLAMDVDYGNFKDAVAARQGKARANAYHQVWSVLYRLTPQRTRKAFRRRRDAELDRQMPLAGAWWEADDTGWHDLTDVHRGDER